MIHLSLETPIRDLRTHLGLSQAELAKRIDVDQSNVSAMERRIPTMRTLARVLAKLGMEPALWATPAVSPTPEVMVRCGHRAGKATKIRAEIRSLDAAEAEALGAAR